MRGTALHDRLVLAVAALFLCAHLAWLPGHLEDIDSINFALGLRDYDVAAHQPHPPGYPVFTLIARGTASLVAPLAGVPSEPTAAMAGSVSAATLSEALAARDALAMGLLSGVAGACALLALYLVLRLIERRREPGDASPLPLLATTLTASAPLFWVTSSRPLSDMPGLAGALACQYLLLDAARPDARLRRAVIAAAACGVATGLRSQVTWLVVPLLIWLLVRVWRRDDVRAAAGVAAAALSGVLVWAVPMVVMTGGIAAYRTALTSQAGEDFDGVPMLALAPEPRRLIVALGDTFVWPWGWWPISALVLVLALAGVLALRQRGRLAAWLALGFLPYLAFHLLFQETETTRYALPLVPLVATLAVAALVRFASRVARPAAVLVCVIAGAAAVQAHHQYVTSDASISEALGRMDDEAQRSGGAQVLMHRRVWAETRRARSVLAPSVGFDVLPAPRSHEWHGAARAWQQGAERVWWLVDPRRGDRVAIDPRAAQLREHVAWPMPVASVLGGMRPHAFDWYVMARPQWVLLDGWGLTPELAGLSAAAGQGPATTGASALVRAQDGEVTVLIGGRHVAAGGAGSIPIDVQVGSVWTQRVEVPPGPFAFTWTLPAGATSGSGYLPLEVRSAAARGGAERIFLEQFDLQPAGTPVLALERGWYEPERDTVSGRQWRWVGDESVLRVAGSRGDVRLVVTGTYPRHYDRAPVLEIFAAGNRVASHTLTRPFRFEQVITATALAADGRLTWRVTPSFVAGERTGTADARRLALEIATLQVQALR
jgi:hypothetical protein